MHTVGIVCEYNPFHLGHQHQFEVIREKFGADCTIVCLMSGNYVQRGAPAIFDKSIRAKAAVLCGADLVLELPVGVALSSAEGFASGGMKILSQCCDTVSFGTESMDTQELFQTAQALLSPEFSAALKDSLSSGRSFPAARSAALKIMGVGIDLKNPNDILGVEYCKAILSLGSQLKIFPVRRVGAYHALQLDVCNPSASAIRCSMERGGSWKNAVPESAADLFEAAPVHTMMAAERAVVSRLRTMSENEFELLPYGSEGLWRKLMKASKTEPDLETIISAVKSKRYTRTRIDRMILCAFLGITEEQIGVIPERVRVLAFSDRGRRLLRMHPEFQNAGEEISDVERRIGDLYGMFCTDRLEAPGAEQRRRVFYHRGNP